MSGHEATPDRRKLSIWRYLGKTLPVIVAVSLLTLALDYYGWLKSLETGALDRFIILQQRVPAAHVAIVEIGNDDYEQLFHEKSPLDAKTLHDLIDAIAQNYPRLIAVDIDTSAKSFKGFDHKTKWPPIVWARGASQAPVEQQEGEDLFVLERVLGGDPLPPNSSTGIALLPEDSDSQIRHFRRKYLMTGPGENSRPADRADSFHWAVVRKYCGLTQGDQRCAELFGPQAEKADEHDLVLNLAIDPYAFETPVKASKVLAEANPENVTGDAPALLSLKDKIVIIGGTYDAARELYDTSVGPKYGVELTSIAVESELSESGLRRVGHVVLVVLEVLAGLVLACLNYKFPRGWKHLLTLLAVPFIALIGSYIAFSSLALWANFIPTLVGVQLHFLYDKVGETKRLEKEVRELKERLKAYGQDEPLPVPDGAAGELKEAEPNAAESDKPAGAEASQPTDKSSATEGNS